MNQKICAVRDIDSATRRARKLRRTGSKKAPPSYFNIALGLELVRTGVSRPVWNCIEIASCDLEDYRTIESVRRMQSLGQHPIGSWDSDRLEFWIVHPNNSMHPCYWVEYAWYHELFLPNEIISISQVHNIESNLFNDSLSHSINLVEMGFAYYTG